MPVIIGLLLTNILDVLREEILKFLAKDGGFLLALSFEAKISAQLSLVDDVLEQRRGVLVIVRTAHDLTDLREGEALAGRFLQE